MRSIRTVTGIGLVVLAAAGIAATRPASTVAGQPTVDPARAAEIDFPYPHLTVTQADDRAKLMLDDGSLDPQTTIAYTVPRDGQPVREKEPVCDEADQICWGTTTVTPWLETQIEFTYAGIPCVIVGSPAVRTSLECSEP